MTSGPSELAVCILDTLLRVVSNAARDNASEDVRRGALCTVLEGLEQGWLTVRAPRCTCGSGCENVARHADSRGAGR